jgi:heme-degrading monooxygenase HmoA
MLVRVWEYEVLEGSVAEFESAYGADGLWAQLFTSEPGFLGSALYRSVAADDRYVTVDLFRNADSWQRFLHYHGEAYERLDARTAHLTMRETELVAADTGDPADNGD